MKFNKELDANAVPEWKAKYLDYKQGKKKLKAVSRAIRTVEKGPSKTNAQRKSPLGNSSREAPVYAFLNREGGGSADGGATARRNARMPVVRSRSDLETVWQRKDDIEATAGAGSSGRRVDERSPLRRAGDGGARDRPGMARYGSIIGSPAGSSTDSMESLSRQRTQASALQLPDPALDPERSKDSQRQEQRQDAVDRDSEQGVGSEGDSNEQRTMPQAPSTQLAHTGNAYEIRQARDKPPEPSTNSLRSILSKPKRTNSSPGDNRRPAFLRRVFSINGAPAAANNSTRDNDVALEAYREIDFRKAEFFLFLDQQLEKIDSFYREKEDEAEARLKVLRHQLHIMRNQRLEELEAAERHNKRHSSSNGDVHENTDEDEGGNGKVPESRHANGAFHTRITNSVVSQMDNALDKLKDVRAGPVGKTSKAMRDLGTPESDRENRDYTRRQESAVPYRTAKRQLKAAITEYYRGLELLKNYALLNHTAFRKITKKCDKALPDFPGREYMKAHVNQGLFITSQTLSSLTDSTEDLYARYFERGNKKMAIEHLRTRGYRQLDYSFGAFRAGFLGGAGIALAIGGVYLGLNDAMASDEMTRVVADYLLQLYAGYFLVLLLAAMFCFECAIFKRNSINYKFIFELNARHSLDWRQLSEMPALFMFLLGLTMTLNFQWVGGRAMYQYWPLVLTGITLTIFLLPYPIYYYKSRKWFLYSSFRLLLSGYFPVEFRDLFLGDLTCSLTYVFGNFALFFCLYAQDWRNPPQCNSSHSIALGVLTTLPGLARAMQCFNRFKETEKAFPHLANALKYSCTIGMYVTLMIYRLNKTWERLVGFALVSTINSVYCIIWDIKMDFSLFDLERKLLRKEMLFEQTWWYYAIMIIDPILRFNWIPYVIFANDLQHSSVVAFFVALTEVIRRGLWALFRVENEQCANNRALKAARDLPVPFVAEPPAPQPGEEPSPLLSALRRVGSTMATAHSQDYVRRTSVMPTPVARPMEYGDSDSDEE